MEGNKMQGMQTLPEESEKGKRLTVLKNYLLVIFGAFLFSISVNWFIAPLGLYNGGSLGAAQIIRTVLTDFAKVKIPGNIDLAGVLYFFINVPLLLLAYKAISRRFFFKTIAAVITQTLCLTLISSPVFNIVDDTLTACLIGGIMGGIGIGCTLLGGGCSGGQDIIGVYLAKKYTNFSVGKLSLGVNFIVYGICAVLFNIRTFIYSVIYAVFSSIILDRVHYQNIMVSVTIITKVEGMEKEITRRLTRGVTYWEGNGAYTGESTYVLVTAVSKYEIHFLKRVVHSLDPKAFLIMGESTSIDGNFVKKI